MTTEAKTTATKTGAEPVHPSLPSERPRLRQFPGLLAIGLYMMLLAGVICHDVAAGHASPFYLVFSVFFIAGALGLMFLLRWGWALTLAAVALMSAFFFWAYSTQKSDSALIQGLLNLVFFLYLIRADLREKMR